MGEAWGVSQFHTNHPLQIDLGHMTFITLGKTSLKQFLASAWMRCVVIAKQSSRVDRGIALRRRKGGMTEQFLYRSQVAAAGQ